MRIIHLLAFPFLLLAIAAAAAEEKASRSFAVPDHGQIQLSYPKAWKVSVRQGPASLKLPPTITLESAEGQKFMVQMTPIPSRDGKAESMEGLRRMAEGRGQHDLQSSRETKIDYQELKSDSARGYYYSLTDKNRDSGEFKYMTAAVVGVGDLVLNVTILDNDPKRPQRQQAIEMLKTAKQIGAATQPAAAALVTNPPAKQLRVAAPGGKFELLMDQRDLQMLGEQGQGNSKAIMAANEDGWAVSIFLEPAAKPGDARVVRAFYEERLKRSPLKREELKLAGDGKKATTEYVIKDLEQKNINVYMVQEGTWVDVHISKTEFAPEEQKMLNELVQSIHVEPAPGKK